MRIILWLVAGVGAAAIGTAAPARPGGGDGGGVPGTWSNGGGHHAGKAVHRGSGPRLSWGYGRHGRRHGRFGRHGRHDFQPYGAGGIAGGIEAVDPHGPGFFAGGGGEIRLRGGRPYFDYDRSYPYEWASAAGGREDWEEEERPTQRPPRCTFENGVRVCRGW